MLKKIVTKFFLLVIVSSCGINFCNGNSNPPYTWDSNPPYTWDTNPPYSW